MTASSLPAHLQYTPLHTLSRTCNVVLRQGIDGLGSLRPLLGEPLVRRQQRHDGVLPSAGLRQVELFSGGRERGIRIIIIFYILITFYNNINIASITLIIN